LEKIVEILTQDKFCYEAQILRVWSQITIQDLFSLPINANLLW
jgi:hypothetical protein